MNRHEAACGAPADLDRADYPAHLVAVLVDVLAGDGIEASTALAGSGIDPRELHLPATRVSQRQILGLCRRAMALDPDPTLALRAGTRMHIAACGIYGYALLSSPSHAAAIEFANRYDRVLGQVADMAFEHRGQQAFWMFRPVHAPDPRDPLHRFLLEFKCSGVLTVMKDLYGPEFGFRCLRATYPAPAHADAYRQRFGCQLQFGHASNEVGFDSAWMEQPMRYADPITNATMRELCDLALERVEAGVGLAARVRAELLGRPGRFPDLPTMAAQLQLHERTLRRRLDAEGSSYRRILSEVRTQLALRYLRDTELTQDEIADRLGYADPATFRQAFTRWKGMSPGQFRQRGTA